MSRTVVNLDPKNKQWLDEEAKRQHVPMTELVRRAVDAYRVREQSRQHPNLEDTLTRTHGIRRHGDGLAEQERLRSEWADRS